MKLKIKSKKAFSLVEISIVILIIGLLVAGISRATDMIYDAEVKAARSMTRGAKLNRMSGLFLWLETSLSESIADSLRVNGTTISRWTDINPQNTGKFIFVNTSTPTFLENGYNNLPGIRLSTTAGAPPVSSLFLPYVNGGSEVRTLPSTAVFSMGAYATIFVVAKPSASTDLLSFCEYSGSPLAVNCSAGKAIRVSVNSDSSPKLIFDFPSSSSATVTATSAGINTNNTIIISALKNGSVNRLFINGGNSVSTANTLLDMPSFNGVFRIGNGTATNSTDIYEIIVFSTNLSDIDRQEVESYLSKKYAITVAKTAS